MSKMPEPDHDLEDSAPADGSDELYERLNLRVDKGQEPLRIDKFLVQRIEGASRNKIQKALGAGLVLVNNRQVTPNYKIKPLDEIILYSDKEARGEEIVPEEMPLQIEYEDDELLIINKPPGLVVHPASGNYSGTLINGVAWYLRQQDRSLNEQTLPRFGLVHRIDKNTSGLMVLAKTEKAVRSLAKQFFDHTVRRQYMALVWGDLVEEKGTIIAHVGRHRRFRKLFDAYPEGDHGKEAITHYTVLERFGYSTLVQCVLETGRTHQIRVHMQHIGHPLFNDETYGGDKIVKGTVFSKYRQFVENCFSLCPRHALHAKTLGFIHPASGKEMLFESELPNDMQQVIAKWRGYIQPTGGKPSYSPR
ncbi:MAG: RluA family pseudouridine synthase [Bacteroidota bacterium]|nr:RluA family pseudouridine synthase [Bacteroidota bacterium]MDP4246108.1 RluA family pseudouridine synthase [Bacteroidota bacterium]MDP4257144.1 RluA family pseudouridine synthase [Bacteroidota bacterium]